jgi:hypothetical protein
MKRKSPFTLAVAVIAVLAGLALIVVEVVQLIAGRGSGAWFWVPIGVLAVVFGVYELLAPAEPQQEVFTRRGGRWRRQ